jgi:hypothetical protein
MGYVPESATWYLAEIVQQITLEGDPRNVVHTNLVLVRADSPEEAYRKALELGTAGDQSYEHPDRKRVTFRFRGLHDLNVIHDELEHGAELIYSEDLDLDESTIRQLVAPKEELGVFLPITPSTGPNYASRDVMEELHRRFPHLAEDGSKPNSASFSQPVQRCRRQPRHVRDQ